MKPDCRFLNQPKSFWANVRTISQHVGYTARGSGQIRVPDPATIVKALAELALGTSDVATRRGNPAPLGSALVAYFAHRADVLNRLVAPRLKDAKQAASAFALVRRETKSKLPIPLNKQNGAKKKPA